MGAKKKARKHEVRGFEGREAYLLFLKTANGGTRKEDDGSRYMTWLPTVWPKENTVDNVAA